MIASSNKTIVVTPIHLLGNAELVAQKTQWLINSPENVTWTYINVDNEAQVYNAYDFHGMKVIIKFSPSYFSMSQSNNYNRHV